MADIFLSYAREDAARAAILARALEQKWTVFWDPNIVPGTSWDDALEQELARCSCVVVVWSAASVRSRWVRNEAGMGLRRNILVPIFLDDTEPPVAFHHVEGVHLLDWKDIAHDPEFASLCEGIRAAIARHEPGPADPVEARRQNQSAPPRDEKQAHDGMNAPQFTVANRRVYQRLLLFYVPTSALGGMLGLAFYLSVAIVVGILASSVEEKDATADAAIVAAMWIGISALFWWCARVVDRSRTPPPRRGIFRDALLLYRPRSRSGWLLHIAFYLFVVFTAAMIVGMIVTAMTDPAAVSDPDVQGIFFTGLFFAGLSLLLRGTARHADI